MEFEKKAPSNNKTFCCVYGCNSKAKRDRTLSFHLFPRQGVRKVNILKPSGNCELVDLQKAWVYKLKMGKPPSKHMRVCSLHFKEDDYKSASDGQCSTRKYLKHNAVPSVNLPQGIVEQMRPTVRREIKKFNIETKSMQEVMETHSLSETQDEVDNMDYTAEERVAAEALLFLCAKTCSDVGVQVNTSAVQTITHLITTDEQLNSITGLHSFKLLDAIEEMIMKEHKDQRVRRLNIRDRIILVFLKLKNDISYVVLSILFGGISSQTCKSIFFEMIPVLSKVLSPLIHFPSKEEVVANLPKCFKGYSNVRIVLDCTEISVQMPKCLCCRIKTYSHYKSGQTIKFMVGVSPAGLITYISKAYGGRASDKSIFEQSRLIEKLIPHIDAVMVDKGFLIDKICDDYGIKLIRPPFLRKKKQLSPDEAQINAMIASARVHIERMNQRIKIFKIMSNTLNWSLIGILDHIFTIICAVCNLSKPILSEERF